MKLGSRVPVVLFAAVSAAIQDVLLTRVDDTNVKVWTKVGSTDEVVATLEHDSKVIAAHVDRSGVVTMEEGKGSATDPVWGKKTAEGKVSVFTPAGAKIATFPGHRLLTAVHDKIVISQNGTVTVWSISSRASLCTLNVGKPLVSTASIDPNGRFVAVQSAKSLPKYGRLEGLQLWNIATCSLHHNFFDIRGLPVFTPPFVPNARAVGFGSSGRRHVPFGFDTSGSRMWVFITTDASAFRSDGNDGNLTIYDTATGALVENKYLGFTCDECADLEMTASKSGNTIAIFGDSHAYQPNNDRWSSHLVLEASTGKVITKASKIVAISDEGDRILTKRLTSWDVTTASSSTKNVSRYLRQLPGFVNASRWNDGFWEVDPALEYLFFHHGSWLAIGADPENCSSSPVKVVSVDTGDEIRTNMVGCLLDAHASTPSGPAPKTTEVPGGHEYAQCGGQEFKGSSKCNPGLECIKQNEYYSQCMKPTHTTTQHFIIA